MKITSRTKRETPADYDWIAHQNPLLAHRHWHEIAAEAGAIVANDILSNFNLHLFTDSEDDGSKWRVVFINDAYTFSEEEGLDALLDDLLTETVCDAQEKASLAALLRKHADRLEAEITSSGT